MNQEIAPKSAAPAEQERREEPKAYEKAIVEHIPQCVTADRLTWSRIFFMPVVGIYFYFYTGVVWPTLLGCGLAGLTDWLDGMVARVRGEQPLQGVHPLHGAHLDAQADKIAVVSMAIPMLLKVIEEMQRLNRLSHCIIALFVVMLAVIIGEATIFGIRQRRYARAKRGLSIDHEVKATKPSKAKTFAEFAAIGLLVISFSKGDMDSYAVRVGLATLTIGLAIGMAGYCVDWLRGR